jgi:hypothetical protein
VHLNYPLLRKRLFHKPTISPEYQELPPESAKAILDAVKNYDNIRKETRRNSKLFHLP